MNKHQKKEADAMKKNKAGGSGSRVDVGGHQIARMPGVKVNKRKK